MIRSLLLRLARSFVSAPVLKRHVGILRLFGVIPAAHRQASQDITRIFFAFPYHTVGDTILALTCLERIHARWPAAEIDVAVGSSVSEIVAHVPWVRTVFRIPPPTSTSVTLAAYQEIAIGLRVFRREIAPNVYDLAITSRWDSFNSFLAGHLMYLTGAPIRCAYSGRNDGGSRINDKFYTHVAFGGAYEHESLRQSRLLARCGLESMDNVDPGLPEHTISTLISLANDRCARGVNLQRPVSRSYVVLAPLSSHARKNWPMERFAELGRMLLEMYGLTSILIGGPGDSSFCEKLRDAIGGPTVSLAGKTSLWETVDVIRSATLFVGNDSGPAHFSGGLGVATYVINFFPSSSTSDHAHSPRRFRPMGPLVYVIQPEQAMEPCLDSCGWDTAHCIQQISVPAVLQVIENTALTMPIELSRR